MSFPMIDVSSLQHPDGERIDFGRVRKAGYRAVMIKATEGQNYVNPYLAGDADAAHEAGLHIGFYHFARPSESAAGLQAAKFLRAINTLPRDIGGALDLEVTGWMSWEQLKVWGQTFLAVIAKEIDTTVLYSDQYFLNRLDGAPWGHKLWLAQWTNQSLPSCWAWQRGQTTVPGIAGSVDFGVYYG